LPSEQLAHYDEGVDVGEGNATFEETGAPLPNYRVQAPLKSLAESKEPADLASSSVVLMSNGWIWVLECRCGIWWVKVDESMQWKCG